MGGFLFLILLQLMKLTGKDIVEMVFFPVVNEACRVLDERIALKASDLDIASIMGMGFPHYRFLSHVLYIFLKGTILLSFCSFTETAIFFPLQFRGGIMFWADSLGANYVSSRLEDWSKMYGEFFKPCAYLVERANKGESLVRHIFPFFFFFFSLYSALIVVCYITYYHLELMQGAQVDLAKSRL